MLATPPKQHKKQALSPLWIVFELAATAVLLKL
jgi:hypothetical protein